MPKNARHMLLARPFSRALYSASILIFHADHLHIRSSRPMKMSRTTLQARRTLRALQKTRVLCDSHTLSTRTIAPRTPTVSFAMSASLRGSLAGQRARRAVHTMVRVVWLTVQFTGTAVIGAVAWTLSRCMITWEYMFLSVGRIMNCRAFNASDMSINTIANSWSEQICMGSSKCEQLVVARVIAR